MGFVSIGVSPGLPQELWCEFDQLVSFIAVIQHAPKRLFPTLTFGTLLDVLC